MRLSSWSPKPLSNFFFYETDIGQKENTLGLGLWLIKTKKQKKKTVSNFSDFFKYYYYWNNMKQICACVIAGVQIDFVSN